MKPVMLIEVPYDGPKLELDPSSLKIPRETVMMDTLRWLVEEGVTEDELPRILTSAVLLFAAGAGTIGQCLDTALVWERG